MSLSLLLPSTIALAESSTNSTSTIESLDAKSILTENQVLNIVNKQLDKQHASPEAYEFFNNYVSNQFKYQNQYSTQGVDDLILARNGGEVYYTMTYSGGGYAASIENQYLSPAATKAIIDKKLNGNLTTFSDVLTTLLGIGISSKFPIIGNIITAYGALETVSNYLDAETIRAIQKVGGQSALLTHSTSQGKNTVWVPWNYYPYIEIPKFSQYIKNISYKTY